jgi:hypothetical protein
MRVTPPWALSKSVSRIKVVPDQALIFDELRHGLGMRLAERGRTKAMQRSGIEFHRSAGAARRTHHATIASGGRLSCRQRWAGDTVVGLPLLAPVTLLGLDALTASTRTIAWMVDLLFRAGCGEFGLPHGQ